MTLRNQTTLSDAAMRRAYGKRIAVQLLGIGSFYVIVLVIFASQSDMFLQPSNIRTIIDGSVVLGIVALGQALAIISGGFDLSVGGVVPLGGVVYAILSQYVGFAGATIVVIALGATVGLLNGLIVTRFKINPLIGTLAMLSITGGLAYIVSSGQAILLPMDPGSGFWGDRWFLGLTWGAWALIVLAMAFAVVLRFTTYGRALYAVGGNAEAAELAGIRVTAVGVSVYVTSGALAAFAGIVAANQLLAGGPNVGTSTTLDSVAAVILGGAALTGGVGGVGGTILGVLLLGTISNALGLLQVPSFYQTVITGVVLLLAVAFGRLRDVVSQHSITTTKERGKK
jgi:ribose transport system permease protein